MSIIHDGIVGNFKMIDNPFVAENLQKYREGSLSISGLTDVVVDTYMDAVVENSVQGKAAKDKAADEKFYRSLREQKQSQKSLSQDKYSSLQRIPGDANAGRMVQTKGDGTQVVWDYTELKIYTLNAKGDIIETKDLKL
jgi:hypothetical protein